MTNTMNELQRRFPEANRRQDRGMGYGTECKQDSQVFHGFDLSAQKRAAGVDFGPDRLVLWWHAANCIGDSAIAQPQTVISLPAIATNTEAELVDGLIKQIAGPVTGEGASGPVGAAQAWSQTDYEQSTLRIAERLDRSIVPTGISAAIELPKRRETRAEQTIPARSGQIWYRQGVWLRWTTTASSFSW